jgi:2-polyprenyl-6-methoxyphenol hydroxylase-like FAD-dependent oxidoreductase
MAARVTGRPLGPRIPNNGGILRPVLHKILSEATRASGAVVRLGISVIGIHQAGEIVTVDFTDGTRCQYDLVVGADGIYSRVRELIFPQAPRPAFTGQGCWRAVIARPPEIDRSVIFVGGRVKPGVTPVSQEEMYLFLVQHVPGNPRMPEDRWPQLLAEQLRGFGGILGEIRDDLGASSRVNYRPLEKQ